MFPRHSFAPGMSIMTAAGDPQSLIGEALP